MNTGFDYIRLHAGNTLDAVAMASSRVLVVGAGVCGMTLGHQLAEGGWAVTVVESEATVGGLAQTYRYDGFAFDSGPHVFLSGSSRVDEFVREVMGGDLVGVPMRGAVHFLGRYYNWPLTPQVVLRLPPKVLLSVARDLFFRLVRPEERDPLTFEGYVLEKYGRTLYELDFGPYTEKFTKLPGSEIHSDWAVVGVSRTVVNRKLAAGSLGRVVRMALRPRRAPLLLCPREGISSFHERLARTITGRNGKILLGSRVESFRIESGRIVSAVIGPEGLEEPCDVVIWTAPLPEVCRLLDSPVPRLEYLPVVLFNVSLRGRPRFDYQWIYYVDAALPFNRVYTNVHFSTESAPLDHHGLCVEVSCRRSDDVWQDPVAHTEAVLDGLVGVGLVERDKVLSVHHEKLANAYPIYRTDYRTERDRALAGIQHVENLMVAGRTGRFWYNTMDRSIENAFEVADAVMGGSKDAAVPLPGS